MDEIEEFLTGIRPSPASQRVLLTVLFTDIVGSTMKAAELGDQRWRDMLLRHNAIVRAQLHRFNGMEVKATGDGFLAAFHGPTNAVECASAVRSGAWEIGLDIRAAVHTGECERLGNDLGGIAVHIASRLLGHAVAGDIVVSRTVKDLAVGSGVSFDARSEVELRDVPGTWQIYAANPASS